jgi:uncharacterized membrane protein YiaA
MADILYSQVHVLAGWWPSHINLSSSNYHLKTLIMAAGSYYIALSQTAQKTPLPTVLLLLGDITIRADHT